MNKAPQMNVLLANPRGFCAGVDRAIEIVERALEKYGAPIYVRHEVVHNRFVVDNLRNKGAVFVDELDEVPEHGFRDIEIRDHSVLHRANGHDATRGSPKHAFRLVSYSQNVLRSGLDSDDGGFS